MTNTSSSIVSKVWSFCHVLRDSGVSYGDYLEQLTFLIFLKMADEYSKPPYGKKIGIPEEYTWPVLKSKRGAELEVKYTSLLLDLGTQPGMLGQIFLKAQNKIADPAMLYKVIAMIDQESWVKLDMDVKGEIYEGLLEKNAEDTKSGAGQYFTPRPLIDVMVECVRPQPRRSIADPACGTGGFLLKAYDYIRTRYELDKDAKEFLKFKTFAGNEIVPGTRRLCLMNMFLHNIGDMTGDVPISSTDALISAGSVRYDYVLTNPPFGKKSSMTFTNEEEQQEKNDLVYNRQDFWATTSNKQFNFLQHIHTILKVGGQAAVVVPDNVLFEGGAGELVRKKLLETTELHTILRLPTGIFYAQGVKANVLFFDVCQASKDPWTKDVWIYDYRTNVHHTLKKSPLKASDLQEFVKCYNPEKRGQRHETWSLETPEGRWRRFTYEEIVARDKTNLDIFWLRDKSLADLDNLPDPDELAGEIIENLEAGLSSFRKIMTVLNSKK
jgi:type I restriction enzyme M protein